jgi:hypothetical protein
MSQRRSLDRLRYVIKMIKLQANSSVGLFTDSTLAPPTQSGTKPATECYILRGPISPRHWNTGSLARITLNGTRYKSFDFSLYCSFVFRENQTRYKYAALDFLVYYIFCLDLESLPTFHEYNQKGDFFWQHSGPSLVL